jgi:hypothetical protein
MQGDLAVDRMRPQPGRAGTGRVVDGHAGLVAAGFDAEDVQGTGEAG